jgi:hypothetical protein
MIQIHEFGFGTETEFYISRTKSGANLICPEDTKEYLHYDYEWRDNTRHPDTKEWNAFFDTYEEAQEFLNEYVRHLEYYYIRLA